MADQATVITKNISLYPDQAEIIDQVARQYGLSSTSAAVRFIITDWQRRRLPASADPGTPEQHPA